MNRRPLTCDIGSLPFSGDLEKFQKGTKLYNSLLELLQPKDPSISEPCQHFEREIVEGLLAKIEAGIDVPNFPQFRDMNEMFFELMDGVGKTKSGYELTGRLRLNSQRRVLPELAVIRRNASRIVETVGHPILLKICVTGPYTLSSMFADKTAEMVRQFAEVLQQIARSSLISQKGMDVSLVSVDEPAFGMTGDAFLDRGSPGREALLKAWESICHEAKARGAKTIIHLHNTTDDLFWSVRDLDLIESHVDDPLYRSEQGRQTCETFDKFIKASIAVTDFDRLIRERIMTSNPSLTEASLGQLVAEAWASIRKGGEDSTVYLESKETMENRLRRILRLFGEERVLFAGPECGTKSFPSLDCAVLCLRRVSEATKLKA